MSTEPSREALAAEVATLTQQLKQLARVEHALTRSRREADRQLERIRRLAQFAFNTAGSEIAADVLDEARRALLDQFELDDVLVADLDSAHHLLVHGPRAIALEPTQWDAIRTLAAPIVEGATASSELGLTHLLRLLEAGPPVAAQWHVCIPIRPQLGERHRLIIAWTARTAPGHRDLPHPDHLPFFQLFANHVARAIDSAHLTTQLRTQGEALAESNLKLSSSLDALERTQAQLVQAQKLEALGRLAGGIAHDFNNLLTVILSHTDLIAESVSHLPGVTEDLHVIGDAARKASEITRGLLAFGRKRDGANTSTELNAATMNLSRMLKRLIGDDITLQVDLDPGIGRVRVEPVHLEQILMNLVMNARDAMPSGGRLQIETRQARASDHPTQDPAAVVDMIALSVTDTGSGMDEATRRQLFEPFFTTKAVGKGTGLGLATVHGLVRQSHGTISVRSAVGRGSTFTVLLPTAERAEQRPPAGGRGRILVVEDEDAIRRMVARVLRRSGFEVHEARDGEEAVRASVGIARLDLVVTDVMMPQMGGPELVAQLRRSSPQLKAVFMSGHTFDRLDVDGLDSKTERFLAKPFTPDELTATVELAFGRAGHPARIA